MKIKKIPWWTRVIFFRKPKGLALMHTVYLSDKLYTEWKSGKPSVEAEAVIAHEQTHAFRFRDTGLNGIIMYFLSAKFRLKEEVAAVKAEIEVYRKHNEEFDYEKRARSWSSINYAFMTSYTKAKKLLLSL